MRTVMEQTEDIRIQAKVFVDTAILRDIQESLLIGNGCNELDYENCEREKKGI